MSGSCSSAKGTLVQADPLNQVDWTFRSRSRFWVDQNPDSRENVMRRALEGLLGLPCPKARPLFLRNPATKRCLELDAFCEERKVACEFQGIQHSQYPNPVHLNKTKFDAQVARDQLKQTLCSTHGVALILVPHTVSRQGMEAYLREQLQRHGLLSVMAQASSEASGPLPVAGAL